MDSLANCELCAPVRSCSMAIDDSSCRKFCVDYIYRVHAAV